MFKLLQKLFPLVYCLSLWTGCDPDQIRPIEIPNQDMLIASDQEVSFIPSALPDLDPNAPDAFVLGEFGDPCEDGNDCFSGFCIDVPRQGKVCTVSCTGECPSEDFECVPTGSGPDRTLLCAPDGHSACLPCGSDAECDDLEDLCLVIGNQTYCSEACDVDEDCPENFECRGVEDRLDDEGQTIRQCFPLSGECAPCMDEDGDGFGIGADCFGFDCNDQENFTYQNAPELCDGLDNDCDRMVDEEISDEPPSDLSCLNEGVCEGIEVSCISNGWGCAYPETYEEDETLCDGLDNDCDGQVDEGFDLAADIFNCGECGYECRFDQGSPICNEGVCEIAQCDRGYYDLNQSQDDGCEYACIVTSRSVLEEQNMEDEIGGQMGGDMNSGGMSMGGQMDGDMGGQMGGRMDDEIGGQMDGDMGGQTEGEVGGQMGGQVGGEMGGGMINYENLEDRQGEFCDEIDNDCDGRIDEEFDLNQDLNHCGECQRQCSFPSASAQCIFGDCELSGCNEGYYNLNGNQEDGCEYACEFNGIENCDDADNDCDGQIDEGFDLSTRLDHCGACNQVCSYPFATSACNEGQCLFVECSPNYYDLDGDLVNGCEYACVVSGEEICDGTDNDCDGQVDETFDFQNDVTHCGQCNLACSFAQASALCIEGVCTLDQCEDGFINLDTQETNGCEYACVPQNLSQDEGVEGEICNESDDDCDGQTDEGYDLNRDLNHCGQCDRVCQFENGIAECNQGDCVLSQCLPNFLDLNGDLSDGCEYACTFTGIEICDGVDNNCNGQIDEGFDLATRLDHCGACNQVCSHPASVSICEAGECRFDSCLPNYYDLNQNSEDGCEYSCVVSGAEACDGVDNDCDGQLDEDFNFTQDPLHCGQCGVRCQFAQASALCEEGVCRLDECQEGWVDLDQNTANGCEYACTYQRDRDVPDLSFEDEDCDGIDGSLNHAVFVSPQGNDDANGLSPSTAVRTIAQGIVQAQQNGRSQVLVAQGTYLISQPVNLVSGISLYGGYSVDFQTRNSTHSQVISSTNRALVVSVLTAGTRVPQIDWSTNDRIGSNESTQTVVVDRSSLFFLLEASEVVAGRGGGGENGDTGTTGSAGSRGRNASGSSGGSGGSIGGGSGGSGRYRASGRTGGAGLRNQSACGGGGGNISTAGLGCNDGSPRAGGNGGNGCVGSSGAEGGNGNGEGQWNGLIWTASNGENGGNGGTGGGGGGGGAGGGENCTAPLVGCLFCGTGRGGGGGGGGGRGGTGGQGGTGGGGSFALVINQSIVSVNQVSLSSRGGGNGGNGGNGGTGGGGGSGGSGETSNEDSNGDGGDGGDGGNGGIGGCGGGGGGGPSILVYGMGSLARLNQLSPVNFNTGVGGQGGASCGNPGENGLSADTVGVRF